MSDHVLKRHCAPHNSCSGLWHNITDAQRAVAELRRSIALAVNTAGGRSKERPSAHRPCLTQRLAGSALAFRLRFHSHEYQARR